MTKGSLAGGYSVTGPPALPLLPAETTTTTPLNQSISAAASTALVLYDSAIALFIEMLTTRML